MYSLCTSSFHLLCIHQVTRAIKQTQCVFTGSQTRKAIMDSIVTFIDICKKKIFHSLMDLNLIVSFRVLAYRTLQEKLNQTQQRKTLNQIIQQRIAPIFFFTILRKIKFPFHNRADAVNRYV